MLTVQLNGDKISISAKQGTNINVWQGNPSYDKVPVEIFARDTAFHLFQQFGRTEGKFVIQLFDSTDLLDEKIINIMPGTPLLVSESKHTEAATLAPGGMLKFLRAVLQCR